MENSKMQPHQQRVVTEKAELDEKISKLTAFLKTEIFFALEEEDQTLLEQQCVTMKEYSTILGKRIARFK